RKVALAQVDRANEIVRRLQGYLSKSESQRKAEDVGILVSRCSLGIATRLRSVVSRPTSPRAPRQSFGRHEQHKVRLDRNYDVPIEAAVLLICPDHAAHEVSEVGREIGSCEGVADDQDRRSGSAGTEGERRRLGLKSRKRRPTDPFGQLQNVG